MKLRMKILILMGSLMLLVFAMNVGLASADNPVDTAHDSPGQADAPIGSHLIAGGADNPGAQGAIHGFGWDFDNPGPNTDFSATVAVANNPLCPLHPDGHGGPHF